MSGETPEQARTRRRWISLAEAVAVAGVLIAALTLYLSWSERRAQDSDRRAEQAQARADAAQERRRIGLVATEIDGDTLSFKGVACALQTSDITFPTALGVAPQNTVLEHRIDTDWFAKPLRKAIGQSGAMRGTLPVLIDSDCVGEGGERSERAIYDLPWKLEGRFLRGDVIRLRGMILRQRGGDQARLDAIWTQIAPKPPAK